MAIAPLPQIDELEWLENPWPKPKLRVVLDPRDSEFRQAPAEEKVWSTGLDVTERRRIRASRKVRRRRAVVVGLLLVIAIGLALPLRALGSVTVTGKATPDGAPIGLLDGSIYTVHEGDTLASIAHELSPSGDQKELIAAMAKELGSTTVVAGEHVQLP